MEDITDADYVHVKRVYKDFEIKKNKIKENIIICTLLADVFQNVRNLCLKMVVNNLYGWEMLEKDSSK